MLLPLLLSTLLAEPITEIGLERSPCFGTCPVDRIVLRSDGTASYVGVRHTERTGDFKGKVSDKDFKELADLLVKADFFAMKDRYSRPITDQATLTTSAKRGDRTKRVADYASAAPESLLEIEKKIVGLIKTIEWEKAK